jgi:hypothetical protein
VFDKNEFEEPVDQQTLQQLDPCIHLFIQVIKQSVDDYAAGIHRLNTIRRAKYRRFVSENFETAREFLFSPAGLETLIERYKMQHALKIDRVRAAALKATKTSYRSKHQRQVI